jgi:hypothetical protein
VVRKTPGSVWSEETGFKLLSGSSTQWWTVRRGVFAPCVANVMGRTGDTERWCKCEGSLGISSIFRSGQSLMEEKKQANGKQGSSRTAAWWALVLST